MITDQSQWNGPLVARDGKRTVGARKIEGPDRHGDYLIEFGEPLRGRGIGVIAAWFGPTGKSRQYRNITISPAAEAPAAEGAGDICQLMPDGGGDAQWPLGTRVRKLKGSSWTIRVVGFHSTKLTPEGYAVESENEPGSVQIYPRAALESTDQ